MEETMDFQSDPFSSAAASDSTLSLPTPDPGPPCSRLPPVTALSSGCGNEPDASTLSSRSPAAGLSVLRLLPFNRRLTPFFSLVKESRRSSMSVSDQRRWWLR